MVADLEGGIALPGGPMLRLLDELAPGQVVVMAKDARMVLVDLASGDEQVFKGPGRFRFDASGHLQGLRPVEVRKHPALGPMKLRLGGMAQVALVMRSGLPAPSLEVLPKGPLVLETAPEFRWQPQGVQATYQFKLFNSKGGTLLDRTLSETRLQAPALKPGEDFTWVLEARLPERPPRIASGRIQVADTATREALLLSRPALGAPFSERLVYAALLEDAQIGDDARAAWQLLAEERPGDSRLKVLAQR